MSNELKNNKTQGKAKAQTFRGSLDQSSKTDNTPKRNPPTKPKKK